MNRVEADQLVLGIDGGGSKTVAWLAVRSTAAEPQVLGRGQAGPSNPQVFGFQPARDSLDEAVAAAFADAGLEPVQVASAVLGLAGSDRDENRARIRQWADRCRLARRFQVVHDALPVLVAGSPDGWGVALISGTGSFAFARTRDGRTARAGGWGYLFGDEGSGYAIAVAGLRWAAKSADGRGPQTQLAHLLLERLRLQEPEELIPRVYSMASDRAQVASLAETVIQAAHDGDAVAQGIVHDAAKELAATVAAAARRAEIHADPFPLALAGGVLLGSDTLVDRLQLNLSQDGMKPATITRVCQPVRGAVLLAQRELPAN